MRVGGQWSEHRLCGNGKRGNGNVVDTICVGTGGVGHIGECRGRHRQCKRRFIKRVVTRLSCQFRASSYR